jgi:hypothetical protein
VNFRFGLEVVNARAPSRTAAPRCTTTNATGYLQGCNLGEGDSMSLIMALRKYGTARTSLALMGTLQAQEVSAVIGLSELRRTAAQRLSRCTGRLLAALRSTAPCRGMSRTTQDDASARGARDAVRGQGQGEGRQKFTGRDTGAAAAAPLRAMKWAN